MGCLPTRRSADRDRARPDVGAVQLRVHALLLGLSAELKPVVAGINVPSDVVGWFQRPGVPQSAGFPHEQLDDPSGSACAAASTEWWMTRMQGAFKPSRADAVAAASVAVSRQAGKPVELVHRQRDRLWARRLEREWWPNRYLLGRQKDPVVRGAADGYLAPGGRLHDPRVAEPRDASSPKPCEGTLVATQDNITRTLELKGDAQGAVLFAERSPGALKSGDLYCGGEFKAFPTDFQAGGGAIVYTEFPAAITGNDTGTAGFRIAIEDNEENIDAEAVLVSLQNLTCVRLNGDRWLKVSFPDHKIDTSVGTGGCSVRPDPPLSPGFTSFRRPKYDRRSDPYGHREPRDAP